MGRGPPPTRVPFPLGPHAPQVGPPTHPPPSQPTKATPAAASTCFFLMFSLRL